MDAATTEEDLRKALETIKSDLLAKQDIAREQAGLPPEEKQSGGTDFSKMSAADADKAYEALPHGATFTDTDGKQKKKP